MSLCDKRNISLFCTYTHKQLRVCVFLPTLWDSSSVDGGRSPYPPSGVWEDRTDLKDSHLMSIYHFWSTKSYSVTKRREYNCLTWFYTHVRGWSWIFGCSRSSSVLVLVKDIHHGGRGVLNIFLYSVGWFPHRLNFLLSQHRVCTPGLMNAPTPSF